MYGLYAEYAKSHGFPALEPADYFGRKREGAGERAIAAVTFPAAVLDEYLKWKRSHIESPEALARDALIPEIREAIAVLAAASSLAAVSARQSQSLLAAELQRLGVGSSFRECLVAGASKAGAIEDYARRAGIVAAEIVVVGDTEVEITAAETLGCRCISVSWGLRSRAFLERHRAPVVVDTVAGLVSALD